jgi:hypothetical protein
MERNEDYRFVAMTLNNLLKIQQQLIDHVNQLEQVCIFVLSFLMKQKIRTETQREIESHFNECFKALKARKEYILSDLDDQVKDRRMFSLHDPHPPI